MSKITERFIKEAEKRDIKFNYEVVEQTGKDREGNEIEYQQMVINGFSQLAEDKAVPYTIIIREDDEMAYVNYRIIISRVAFVEDREKLPEILIEFNELNKIKMGSYRVVVHSDGEVHMFNSGVIGPDPMPMLSTFIGGVQTLGAALPELQKIEGLDLSTRLD